MARLATLAVLLLSFLTVASCRVLEVEAISDDQGPPNPVLEDATAEVTLPRLPTPTVAGGEGMLRLPAQRRPCNLHRHLWWARHHGLSHHRGAFSDPGEARSVPAVVPTELARGEEQEPPIEAELVAVAEPDPDSRPDIDADAEFEPKQFHGEEEGEAAEAWKVEMLRRFRHGIRFLHRHHLRHHHEHEEEDDHDHEDKDDGMKMKLFRRFHHHHHHAHDSDGEADEVEELARRLSEAIMRRRVSHGGAHHHHHGAEEGGVKKWFQGLMNRF